MTAVVHPRGLTRDGRAAIEALFRDHLERGWHPGAQLAVFRDGRLELDLVGGDAKRGRPLRAGDPMLLFSSSKPLIALVVLLLCERGKLRLDDPIAVYWPEFGVGGKAVATIRHALSHQAACPQLSVDFDLNRVDDWQYAVERTASLPAAWPPGTDVGYHTLTFGWILGELARRIDGRMPREIVRDEVTAPLGVPDELSIGLPPERVAHRVPVHAMSERTRHDPSGGERSTSRVVDAYNTEVVARAQIPAANGFGTARALARVYAALLPPALGGGELLAQPTVAEATRVQAQTLNDRSQGVPKRYGLGFYLSGLAGDPFDCHAGEGVFGHAGQQSSVGYADPRFGLAAAYVTNGLHEPAVVERRMAEMSEAIRAACA